MRFSPLLLLLFPFTVLAQHDHSSLPQKTVPVTMPDGRKGMAVPMKGDNAEAAGHYAIPLGNGPNADGQCWLVIPETGEYRILNASIGKDKSAKPMLRVAGQIYRIGMHKGPLIWVKPNGKREAVPKENQIAIPLDHIYRNQD